MFILESFLAKKEIQIEKFTKKEIRFSLTLTFIPKTRTLEIPFGIGEEICGNQTRP